MRHEVGGIPENSTERVSLWLVRWVQPLLMVARVLCVRQLRWWHVRSPLSCEVIAWTRQASRRVGLTIVEPVERFSDCSLRSLLFDSLAG